MKSISISYIIEWIDFIYHHSIRNGVTQGEYMFQKRRRLEKFIFCSIDLLCIMLSLGIAFQLRFGLWYGDRENFDQLWQALLLIVTYFGVDTFTRTNENFFQQGIVKKLYYVIRMAIFLSVAWIAVIFMMHKIEALARLVYGYFFVSYIVLVFLLRMIVGQYMLRIYKMGRYSSRILLVTDRRHARETVRRIYQAKEWFRVLVGIVLVDGGTQEEPIDNIPVVANGDTMLEYALHEELDEVLFVQIRDVPHKQQKEWIRELQLMGVAVDVNIDLLDIVKQGRREVNRVGSFTVVTFVRNVFSTKKLLVKRLMDIVGGLIGTIFVLILTIFLTPIIKLESKGPVFYSQVRVGKNGRRFKIYKFRSMYQDADARKKELMEKNELSGPMFKMENDPRITKVGRFLRRTSLDEFPQFINVLKGDMSLVGTRPPTEDELEQYQAKHKARLSMTPGLTGMWQVSGRSDIQDFDEVVNLDMQYIDEWSLAKDIKILLKTVVVVLANKGAK